ncbi:pre-toxin TG domain-containing protein [Peribacillus butanolivorans]|uniref:pre-toxin TG domain-containing protein n=1 Tax=Peribacillus butanolivorans TaxID=421767 RepID=UPI0035E0AA64
MGYDKTFTGEFTGYYHSIRASTGVYPVTGRKLSEAERIAAAGFILVIGWAGRAIKGAAPSTKRPKDSTRRIMHSLPIKRQKAVASYRKPNMASPQPTD